MENALSQKEYEIILKKCLEKARKAGLNLDTLLDFDPKITAEHPDPESSFADLIFQMLMHHESKKEITRKTKQMSGIKKAKQSGVKFGRPSTPVPKEFFALYNKWQKGEIKAETAIKKLGVSKTTFYTWVKRLRQDNSN